MELSQTFVANNNFSALVTSLNQNLESEPKLLLLPVEETGTEAVNITCEPDSPSKHNEFIDMDENTNTELVDMDLEDTMSVYTSFSMDTSITVNGRNGSKKKRRHRKSILCKSNRKVRKQDDQFLSPAESHFCNICNKMFRSQAGLATHKTTLTHISKLSEQEFLRSKLEGESIDAPSVEVVQTQTPPPTEIHIVPVSSAQAVSPIVKINDVHFSETCEENDASKIESIATEKLPDIPRATTPVIDTSYLHQSGIEPISSPEQFDYNTDRYKSRSNTNLQSDNSRLALSQEERLFYECCSMLKGSERPSANTSQKYYPMSRIATANTMPTTKPVTPKSNEQYSYVVPEGSKHSKGIPKIDLNQFSDISSDSNPAYSCPQIPSSSETQNIFLREQQTQNESNFATSVYQSTSTAISVSSSSFEKSLNQYDSERMTTKKTADNIYNGDNGQPVSTDHFVPTNIDRSSLSLYQMNNYSSFGQKSTAFTQSPDNKNRHGNELAVLDGDNTKSYIHR